MAAISPILFRVSLAASMLAATPTLADLRLSDFDYPFPVQTYSFQSQGEVRDMAYMDVSPGRVEDPPVVVLLHGKNFSGAYWEETANALLQEGYRVVMPDQIGFGKSIKPENYHYTFHQLARNTRGLMKYLGVESAHVLGHSMGGMLAARYALMYPDLTESLILLNPIGLEDWKALGVPYVGVDQWYQNELDQTPEQIRDYMRESYYDGDWDPAYDRWVEMLARFIDSEDYERMAWNQALTYDMIYTQPVIYEFSELELPTLLIIGQRDRTALGRNLVSERLREQLGRYDRLGEQAAAAIPQARLVELDEIGHLPHIEAFDRFFEPLRAFLESPAAGE